MRFEKIFFLFFCSMFVIFDVNANIIFRQATRAFMPGILTLMNNYMIKDCDRLVILPKLFRQRALEKDIDDNRIFTAIDSSAGNEKVIAHQKVFKIDNNEERLNMMKKVIRCYQIEPLKTYMINRNIC